MIITLDFLNIIFIWKNMYFVIGSCFIENEASQNNLFIRVSNMLRYVALRRLSVKHSGRRLEFKLFPFWSKITSRIKTRDENQDILGVKYHDFQRSFKFLLFHNSRHTLKFILFRCVCQNFNDFYCLCCMFWFYFYIKYKIMVYCIF